MPTLETLAAAAILRERLPELKVRVVNVVDLMRLQPESEHPHGLSDSQFDALFTIDRPVVFAYHGYPWLIHRLTYRRANHDNLHVRGYKEEGTTTTPFDMVMLNDLDRFHLVIDVIDRVPALGERAAHLRQEMEDARLRARAYTREHGEDDPEIRDWTWPSSAVSSILVVNAGSTSLKLSIVDGDDAVAAGRRRLRTRTTSTPSAHRVVHGGARFGEPVVVDDARARRARRRSPSSRRCTSAGARGDRRGATRAAGRAHVAVFDTAFHATMPEEAATYALPARWRDEWGIRRYGFHGLSVQWAAERVRRRAARRLPPRRRLLGDRRARRPLGRHDDGLQPARGRADGDALRARSTPGSLLLSPADGTLGVDELEHALEHESGLLGLSGDRATSTSSSARRTPTARLALAVFAHRVAAAVARDGRCARRPRRARLHGRDRRGLGGRACATSCARLGFLGVELDRGRERRRGSRRRRHPAGSAVRVVVLHAREDVVAARARERCSAANRARASPAPPSPFEPRVVVRELVQVRAGDLSRVDRVVSRHVVARSWRPCSSSTSIPLRNRSTSKGDVPQSIPISSPTRRASSAVNPLRADIATSLYAGAPRVRAAARCARRRRCHSRPHAAPGTSLRPLEPLDLLGLRSRAKPDVDREASRVADGRSRRRHLDRVDGQLLRPRVHDDCRRDAGGERSREELVRRGRAAAAAAALRLVGDEPVAAVDQHLLAERAGDGSGLTL